MPLLDSKQQLHSFYVLVLFKQRITGSRITRVMRKYGRTELICAFCLALTSVTGGPFEFNFFGNFNIINLTGGLARQSDPEFPSAHSPGALPARLSGNCTQFELFMKTNFLTLLLWVSLSLHGQAQTSIKEFEITVSSFNFPIRPFG